MKTYEQTISDLFARKAEYDKQMKKRKKLTSTVAAVICAITVVSLSFGVYAYAADVREYNEAVQYLDSIDYSTEGMSRGEIKKIYRAIVASAESGVSAEDEKDVVIAITGSDINGMTDPSAADVGKTYEIVKGNGKDALNRLQKQDGDTVLWTFSSENISVNGYCPTEDGNVVVCGGLETFKNGAVHACQAFTMLDENGQTVWQTADCDGQTPGFDFVYGYASGIFEKENGGFFSLGFNMKQNGDDVKTYLILTHISESGEILDKNEIPTTEYFGEKRFVGLRYCTRYEDSFVAYISANGFDHFEGLVKISPEGEIGQVFSFSENGVEYIVNDIKEYGGRLWISADAVKANRGQGDEYASVRANLLYAPLYSLVTGDGNGFLPHDCTDILKNNCEAVLLVCDPDADSPYTYYKESGAASGAIGMNDLGGLTWKTRSIESGTAFYKKINSDPSKALEVLYSYVEHQYTFAEDYRSAAKTVTDIQTGAKF